MEPATTPRLNRKRALWLAGFGALGVSLAQFGLLEPLMHVVPRCPTHTLTGLYCPGCGGTRALAHLLHLDLPGALHMNALAVLGAPAALYLLLWPAPRRSLTRWQVFLLMSLIAAFTAIRNLPNYPFNTLAPY